MSNMRYRKPSVKTVLGVTKWKKRVKKALGVNKLLWPFRAVTNYKRRVLRQAGYYNPEMKMLRAAKRGQAPGPIGPLQIGERGDGEKGADNSALLMAAMLTQGDHKGASGEKSHNDNSLLMAAMLAKGDHQKGENAGPNLAQAMLLSSAMKGTEEEHAPKAKQANKQDAPGAAHPHAARVKAKPAEEQPAPKRRRGLRLFSLLLMTLLETTVIFAAWFYWFA